jgi:hypothetical protein
MRFRRKLALLVVLIALAVPLVCYWLRPATMVVRVPFQLAVQELRSLYPVPGPRMELPDAPAGKWNLEALRQAYPAYRGYQNPLWDLKVRHTDEAPGERYRIDIENSAKFERRETAIVIERVDDGVRVTVLSQETEYLLTKGTKWRDRSYERERLREIHERLRQAAP